MTMSLNEGSNGFWKVVEIDNAIFHEPDSFGKGKFFKISIEKLWILFRKILEYTKISVLLNTAYVMFSSFYNI